MTIHYLGIRHHSPACAHLVADTIQKLKPKAILIEGPCDFNARIDELLLPHQLPIALYSYRYDGKQSAQSWFPFLDYSPELVALKKGSAVGSSLYFMDLPHWSYRAHVAEFWSSQPDELNSNTKKDRYQTVLADLLKQSGCDNQDALWDSWFEHAPSDELAERLAQYFLTLRGDELGSHEDQLREGFMAQWINYIASQHKKNASILVVCGGWHVEALKRLSMDAKSIQPSAQSKQASETSVSQASSQTANPPDPEQFIQALTAQYSNTSDSSTDTDSEDLNENTEKNTIEKGNYLIPYEFRQVDALSGYGAGMPSPQYYQWLYDNPDSTHNKAIMQMTQALRDAKQSMGTADLIAWQHSSLSLAALRGHRQPSRHDLLDGFVSSCIKEALTDLPPWSDNTGNYLRTLRTTDHPALKAVLLALTGEKRGRLANATPQPPLLKQVTDILTQYDVLPETTGRTLHLSWRDPVHRKQLNLLWQLHCIGCDSVKKTTTSKRKKTTLIDAEESWFLQKNLQWDVQLIEASRFGATLSLAAKTALAEKLVSTQGIQTAEQAQNITNVFVFAIRAGFLDWSDELLGKLLILLPQIQTREPLAHIGTSLMQLQQQGFWGGDIDALLTKPLHLIVNHLAWLLDSTARHSTQSADADIQIIQLIDYMIKHMTNQPDASLDATFDVVTASDLIELTERIILDNDSAPTLRGAALGVYHNHQRHQSQQNENPKNDNQQDAMDNNHRSNINTNIEMVNVISAVPPKEALGDFLNGLFACARETLQRDDEILHGIHEAITGLVVEDFLDALPALRGAFSWFTPKERQKLALSLASHLGLSQTATQMMQIQIAKPVNDETLLIQAKQIEAKAQNWLQQIMG